MGISVDDIRRALDEGVVGIRPDFSVPGETRYFLFLRDHPAEGPVDRMGREVFLGSIPGSSEMYLVQRESLIGEGTLSNGSLMFLKDMTESNGEFSDLLAQNVSRLGMPAGD